ncbi:hypothetical protein ES705_43882 [subsurface metagenome]
MIPQRRAVKEELLADRRRWGSAAMECEGRAFRRHKVHLCQGGLELNEVLFPRNVFQRLKTSEQVYFWHRLNCSVMCDWSHDTFGHTPEYRAWFLDRMIWIYGFEEVRMWVENAPLKIKQTKGGVF